MRRRKGEYESYGIFYSDSELRKMRSDDIPEMYIALRKIWEEEGPFADSLVHKSFIEQVSATIDRFYTKEQIKKWEEILRGRKEDTKEGEYEELRSKLNPPIPYKARKMPFLIRWFGNGWKALRRKK